MRLGLWFRTGLRDWQGYIPIVPILAAYRRDDLNHDLIAGLVVGMVTGFVGVGGGFMIVPALVLLGGLAIHNAVATSLVIIALKSYSGLYKYIDVLGAQGLELDWRTLMIVTGLGIAGSFAGARIANRLPQATLKRWFGVFLILMGMYILARSAPEALGLMI